MHIPAQGSAPGTPLQAHGQQRPHDLGKSRRRCGRQCRGPGQVGVTLVRQSEQALLEAGQQDLPLAPARRERWHAPLQEARAVHQRVASPSRRLTAGKPLAHGTIVHASDGTLAPIGQGTSNCPAQCGRTPGSITAPAAGVILATPLPVGNPSAARDGRPWVDKVQQAIVRGAARPPPAIHALAGDLALHEAAWRAALHTRRLLTVGIPPTVEPITPSPTQEEGRRLVNEAGLHRPRPPHQGHLAGACGDSRPMVESVMASLLCRGAARIRSKGHRGALGQTGMTVMAHTAAVLARIGQHRLAKRAPKFRRLLCLKRRNVN